MLNQRRIFFIVVLMLVAAMLASCGGGAAKPAVEIISPPSGAQIALGEQVEVEYRASDPTAVVRVDLEVDGRVVDSQSSPVADGQPSLSGMLRWTPTEEGTHALLVYAYNRDRAPSDPVGVNIIVGGGAAPGSTVTISLILPKVTGTPGDTSTQPPGTAVATQPKSGTTGTPTGPSTTTPTSRPPTATATRQAPAATATSRPPTATATRRPTATPETPPARIEMRNRSGEEVWFVHFDSPNHNFADDQLGSDIVGPGQDHNWNVVAATFHLQAVASDWYVLDERWSESVQGHYVWMISPRPQTMANITVRNQSGVDVCTVYISDAGAPWGDNWLTGGGFIGPGGSVSFQVTAGDKDFLAADCSDNLLDEHYGVSVSGTYEWSIPPGAPPPAATGGIFMHNDSGEGVWYVYWTETGQPFDESDDKLGSTIVPNGETFEWTGIPVGYYDLMARGQNNAYLDSEVGIYVPPGDYYHWFVAF